MDKYDVLKLFERTFSHSTDIEAYFAPGRVNLIGEHTDYNGGHVLPCALTFGTYAAARRRNDTTIRLYSENFPESGIIEFNLDNLTNDPRHGWANYPKGVIWAFIKNEFNLTSGLDAVFWGDMPSGAGLSSSASIEMAASVMLSSLFSLHMESEDGLSRMALIGKEVENHFIGVNSGIMDQFAIALGKADTALFLDCATLKKTFVPLKLGDYEIVIMNTNKSRKLIESKYNERRNECEKALSDIKKAGSPIEALGDLSEDDFAKWEHSIVDPICRRRARHAVLENRRVISAVEALKAEKLEAFGKLLNESHLSLQFDYETTGVELDCLAELSWQQNECIGARMTGAGFGGSAIALVQRSGIEKFTRSVGEKYRLYIGYDCSFYCSTTGDGARRIH